MIELLFKKSWPHLLAIGIFIVLAFAYMSPVLQGKRIRQMDVTHAKGQSAELENYHNQTGNYALWTNRMFGGMPAYQINMTHAPNYSIFYHLSHFIRLYCYSNSVEIFILYLIGFYILLLSFNLSPWLSILGSIAFALSSYNLIYIEAGHINKTLAIAMTPAALAGALLIFNKKYLTGSIVFCLFLGLQLAFNHIQITYYFFLMVLVLGIVEFIFAIREKTFRHFLIASSLLILMSAFAILPDTRNLLTTYEYGKESMRGGSELAQFERGNQESGLEKSYSLAWSYGKAETFTLLIPNFRGGSTNGELSESSNLYKALRENGIPASQAKQYIQQVPVYWGSKTFTSGPFYFGAIICFLFVLGLILIPGKIKWWIITISGLAILWSWGENFLGFNSLFFDYFPLFNKFRVPETFLVIASITFPLLAVLALNQLIVKEKDIDKIKKALLLSLYITGGICLFFVLFSKTLFDFVSLTDSQMQGIPEWFMAALYDDRARLLKLDAFRSFVFIFIGFGLCWFYFTNKMKLKYFFVLLCVFVLFDQWSIDKRYLNSNDFIPKELSSEIRPNAANIDILKDKDPDFRVFNMMQNPFNDAYTSYFHNSIGGYHGAKMSRYQDLIDNHLSKQNMNVVNMLNTKYFIVPDQDKNPSAQLNPGACGNAWFVSEVRFVSNAKEEIAALGNFNPKTTAFVDKKYHTYFNTIKLPDSLQNSVITLSDYKPDKILYKSSSASGGFVVFSEIYYNDHKGWKAYVDGNPVPHIRTNYVLRGLYLSKGDHTVEFRFEPATFYLGQKISLVASILAGMIILFFGIIEIKKFSQTQLAQGKVNIKEN